MGSSTTLLNYHHPIEITNLSLMKVQLANTGETGPSGVSIEATGSLNSFPTGNIEFYCNFGNSSPYTYVKAILSPNNNLAGTAMTSNQMICPDVPRFDNTILTGTSTLTYITFQVTYNKQELWGANKI
jgi:hypothetical protein